MMKYWLNTDYRLGDYNVPKLSLNDDNGVVIWDTYENIGVDPKAEWVSYDDIDKWIEATLGFLPDYEIN